MTSHTIFMYEKSVYARPILKIYLFHQQVTKVY